MLLSCGKQPCARVNRAQVFCRVYKSSGLALFDSDALTFDLRTPPSSLHFTIFTPPPPPQPNLVVLPRLDLNI